MLSPGHVVRCPSKPLGRPPFSQQFGLQRRTVQFIRTQTRPHGASGGRPRGLPEEEARGHHAQ